MAIFSFYIINFMISMKIVQNRQFYFGYNFGWDFIHSRSNSQKKLIAFLLTNKYCKKMHENCIAKQIYAIWCERCKKNRKNKRETYTKKRKKKLQQKRLTHKHMHKVYYNSSLHYTIIRLHKYINTDTHTV